MVSSSDTSFVLQTDFIPVRADTNCLTRLRNVSLKSTNLSY